MGLVFILVVLEKFNVLGTSLQNCQVRICSVLGWLFQNIYCILKIIFLLLASKDNFAYLDQQLHRKMSWNGIRVLTGLNIEFLYFGVERALKYCFIF